MVTFLSFLTFFIVVSIVCLSQNGTYSRLILSPSHNLSVIPSTTTISNFRSGVDQEKIESILSAYSEIDASVSIIKGGKNYDLGSREPFIAASTTKVMTAACFLKQTEAGRTNLGYLINGEKASALLSKMVNQSDNNAWYSLNSFLGYDYLESCVASWGVTSFDSEANTITAADLALFLNKLWERQLLSAENTEFLLSLMVSTNREDLIAAAAPSGSTVFHKYGFLENQLHDVGIIATSTGEITLSVMTASKTELSTVDQISLIREITAYVSKL